MNPSSALRKIFPLTFSALALQALGACAASPMPDIAMAPMAMMEDSAQAPQVLTENHFRSDRTGNLNEDQIREILDAPIFLEDTARVGIVPVATAYELDNELPLDAVPQHLSGALESTGFFDVTTEISTDWPSVRSIAGLRELAARYRVKYLLLYRQRFLDREYTNGWGWTYPTIIGAMLAPGNTMQSVGVMEASLFDVRTGTILFTVFHRVEGTIDENIWNNDIKRRELKEDLLLEGTQALADDMVHQVRRLDAARDIWLKAHPAKALTQAPAQAPAQAMTGAP